jgi:uncharacterized protein (TIGR02145 family)
MKSKTNIRIYLLVIMGIFFISINNCKKSEAPSRGQLLTSSLWSLTIDCSGNLITDEEYSVTSFKTDGVMVIKYRTGDDLNSTWSLKDNDETLVFNDEYFEIMTLTKTELQITSKASGCKLSFRALLLTKATTTGVSALSSTMAELHGTVRTDNLSIQVTFEYGTSTSYGQTVSATMSPVSGPSLTNIDAPLSGLIPEATYHYRIKAICSSGSFYGQDLTFKTFNSQTVSDIDGNIYNTVTIGTQVWMVENLKTTKYRNGDPIPNVTDEIQWSNLTTGGYCNYDNDISNVTTYGRLYNWYAVNDSRNIAPIGWHVATDAEWTTLTDYLGGENVAGSKLKEFGTAHWQSPNDDATNESGFTALPGGDRFFNGPFNYMTGMGFWLCWADGVLGSAWGRSLVRGFGNVDRYNEPDYEASGGCSVRCIKD